METKRELIHRLSKNMDNCKMIFGHGIYRRIPNTPPNNNAPRLRSKFIVRPGQIFIFMCRSSRYLPSTIVDDKFYDLFTSPSNIRGVLTDGRHHHAPLIMSEWRDRTYGPGQECYDLHLNLDDPTWKMGIYELPLYRGQLYRSVKRKPVIMHLSEITEPGLYFVNACRAVEGQSSYINNLTARYNYNIGTRESNIQFQNKITSSMNKRKAIGTASLRTFKRRNIK
jgi:hypothetical protein